MSQIVFYLKNKNLIKIDILYGLQKPRKQILSDEASIEPNV